MEIRQYKKQQKEAVGLLDTLDIAERQPVFLKDKGDALYSQGNFKGAINAYSTAIQLDPEHLLSYSNRAACWLKLGDADRCLADCEVAVELLGPRAKRWEKGDAEPGELERFRKTMARVLSRKAAAHCQVRAQLPSMPLQPRSADAAVEAAARCAAVRCCPEDVPSPDASPSGCVFPVVFTPARPGELQHWVLLCPDALPAHSHVGFLRSLPLPAVMHRSPARPSHALFPPARAPPLLRTQVLAGSG